MKKKDATAEQSLVLIVDDNPNDLQIIGNILKAVNYKIAVFTGAYDALEFIKKKQPDIIILDIMMPDTDGYELCRQIKQLDFAREIPVIFISALRETVDIVKGFEIGGMDYITKPFRKEEVLSRVNAHLTIFKQKKELNKLNETLKDSNSTKDKFFSIIAHDLKNPLGAFKNVTSFLLKNFNTLQEEEKLDFIDLMNQSAHHVYSLLENLLNWSRSQTGRMEFNPEKFDLSMIVNDSIQLLKITADKKEITLINNIAPGTMIFADINMITTVVRNLISNAIKFTHKDGSISVSGYNNINGFIQVEVSDTGIGMNEDIKQKLFNIKHHHTTLGTGNEKGTGLGLILCKEFVEKNNGKIWVESEFNKGSKFCFTIPSMHL
jgi:two-component system, sensor histidine kinase and response regulator